MKSGILIFLTFALTSWSCLGQSGSSKVTILQGPPFKAGKKTSPKQIILSDNTGVYHYAYEGGISGRGSILQKFGPDLSFSKAVDQTYSVLDRRLTLRHLVPFDGSLYALCTRTDYAQSAENFYACKVDKETLQNDGFPTSLASIPIKENFLTVQHGAFEHAISKDESKLLVYSFPPNEVNTSKKINIRVFHEGLKLLWEGFYELPYEDDMFSTVRLQLGNDGKVYIVAKHYKQRRSLFSVGEPEFDMVIIVFEKDKATPTVHPIEIEDKFVTDAQISVRNDGNIVCAGFYSDRGTGSIKGSYYLAIDPKSETTSQLNYQDFDLNFMAMGLSARAEKRMNRNLDRGASYELYNYDLRDIIQRNDGGAILIGEQFKIRVVTHSIPNANGGSTTHTTRYYHYEDIIVINMSPTGKTEWQQKIPKNQVTTDDNGMYSSYALKVMKDKIHFIFNDNPRNLYYNGGEALTCAMRTKHTIPLLVTVGKSGEVEREALRSASEMDYLLRPKLMTVTGANEIMFYSTEKKAHRLNRIEFKR